MNTMTQISVFLENKVGTLASACKVLAEANISLVALSIAGVQDFGIARFVTDDPAKAQEALRKARFVAQATPVVGIAVPDAPGGMAQVVTTLSERGCGIEYSYAFSGSDGNAILVFKFDDLEKALEVIASAGYRTIARG
ncbi:MAG: ACT domain-containing protein [Kiritimatiellia bacterium]